ncbi:MAG: sulfurtransferase [Bacillus sp. (in: firmicutes)]
MLYIVLIVSLFILFYLYRRYVPVRGVPCKQVNHEENQVIVDLRDYNISHKNQLAGSINIPVAYLQRHLHEIPSKQVHVIAQNQVEKNIGIRLLRRNGIQVYSYSMSDCFCK